MKKRTALLLGIFILAAFSPAGAEEASSNTVPPAALSEPSRKGTESRRPPEEVIRNLELFQNLPLLKEIELYEQMPSRTAKKKCIEPSADCSKENAATEMNRKKEVAE